MKLFLTTVLAFLITGGVGMYSVFTKNDSHGLLIISITWLLFFLINRKNKIRRQ